MDNTNSQSFEYEIYMKDTTHNSLSDHKEVQQNEQQRAIDHTPQYNTQFKDVQIIVNQKIAQCNNLTENKLKHKISTMNNENDFSDLVNFNNTRIFVVGSQYNGLIINYQVLLGNLKISLSMINQSIDAPIRLKSIGQGSFGEIFIIPTSKNKSIACKRTKFIRKTVIWPQNQQGAQLRQAWEIRANIDQIHETILEYSIYRICSFYKIGPSTVDCLGFDLVCFNDAIQFYMQHCDRQFTSQHYEKELKICARILHKMKIVHKDIKPQNILYSQTHQTYIMTDFGISHPVQEQPGQLTQTYQQGTPGYMSPDMVNIKSKNKPGFIDLYYNDLYALKTSIAEIKWIRQRNKVVNQQQQMPRSINKVNKKLHIQYLTIKAIFMILNSNEQDIIQFIKEYNLYKIFFEQLAYLSIHSAKYRKVSEKLVQNEQKFLNYHTQVKQISFLSEKRLSMEQIQFMIRGYGMTQQLTYQLKKFEQNWRIRNIVNDLNALNLGIPVIKQFKICTYPRLYYIKSKEKYLENRRKSNLYKSNRQISEIIDMSFMVLYYYIQLPMYHKQAKHMYQQISQYKNSFSTQHMVQYELITIILQFTNSQNNQNRHNRLLKLLKIYPKETFLNYSLYLIIMINMVSQIHVIKQFEQFLGHYKQIQWTQIQIKTLIQLKLIIINLQLKQPPTKKIINSITQLQKIIKYHNLQMVYYIHITQLKGLSYVQNHQPKKAIQIFEELIKTIKQNQGKNSFKLLKCKIHLGKCYLEVKQLQKSQMYLVQSVEQLSQFYGQNNKTYLDCLVPLIGIYIKKNLVNKVGMYYEIWSSLIYKFGLEQEFDKFQTNRLILNFYFENGLTSEIQKILSRIEQKYKNKSLIKHYCYLLIIADYYTYNTDIIKVREIQKQLSILNKSLSQSQYNLNINFLYANICKICGSQYYEEAYRHYQFVQSHTDADNNFNWHISSIYQLGKLCLRKFEYKQGYLHLNCLLEIVRQYNFDDDQLQIQLRFKIIGCLVQMKQFDNVFENIVKAVERFQDKKMILSYKYFEQIKKAIVICFIHSKKTNKQKKILIQSFKKLNSGSQDNANDGLLYHRNLILTVYVTYHKIKMYMHAIYYLQYLTSNNSSIIINHQSESIYTLFYQKYKIKKQRAIKHELQFIKWYLNADLCYRHCRLIKFYSICRAKTICLILLTFLLQKVCKCQISLQFLSFYKLFQKGFKYRVCNEIVKTRKLIISNKKEKTSQKLKKISLFKKIQFLNRKLKLTHKLEPLIKQIDLVFI